MLNRIERLLPDSLKDGPDRIIFSLLAGSVSFSLISIAASQLFLAGAVVYALWLWKGHGAWQLPPSALPLAFFFLWSAAAVLISHEPRVGLGILKKFFLFALLLLIPRHLNGKGRVLRIYEAVFCAALISSAAGIVQYMQNPHRDLLHRISGFQSQWMTYSGLLMLALVALSAYIMCIGLGKSAWTLPLGLIIIIPMALSLTRNAWLGAIAGLLVVLLAVRPRAIGGLLVILLLLVMLSPGNIRDRIRSGFNPADDNTRNRIELFETSLRLIKDHPWFGVGGNVATEALRYRGTREFPDWMYQHLHNNILQIAAERGIPGLLFWLWFIATLAWDGWRLRRAGTSGPDRRMGRLESNERLFASAAALGCCAALMCAGLVEYNFGDSEVLMLFLFIMGAPYSFLGRTPAEGQ